MPNDLPADPALDDDEEFSLDQLSAAYARVLKGTDNQDPDFDDESDIGTTDDDPSSDLASATSTTTEPADSTVDDNAGCPISPESIIESILFVGTPKDSKLTSKKIAAILRDVSPKEVTKIIKQLNAGYATENAAYRIATVDGSINMVLDESLHSFQQEYFGRNKSVKLSQVAIDVLAVVAYNQPITKVEIEKLRAKSSGGILKQLVRRELLMIIPQEQDSKTLRYATTDKFLDFFNLENIEDLPQSHDVSEFDEFTD